MLSDGFPLTGGGEKARVNNNIFCLPLQTPQSGEYLLSHESLLIIGEVCRKGEGGFLIVYLMWFLSACLITALPGSSPSFFCHHGCFHADRAKRETYTSTAKGSHFDCAEMIFIYPYTLMTTAPLFGGFFTADFQIKDLSVQIKSTNQDPNISLI